MANSSAENASKFKDKHSSHSNQKESESNRYISPMNRKRSPHSRMQRDASQERRDQLEQRKIHFTEDRRIAYRSEEKFNRTSERYKSRIPPHDDRYGHHRSSERDRHYSSEKSIDHHKSSNERQHANHVSSEMNNRQSSEKVIDQYKSADERSSHDGRYISYKSSESYRLSSEKTTDHLKPTDERHISFRNSAVTGEEEFIASLLQKIDFLSNQVDYLTQENEKLKHSAINSKEDLPHKSAAEVSIVFQNKKFEEKFLPTLKELATDLIIGRCSVEGLNKFLESSDVSQSENWNAEGEIFALDISCDEPKESSSVPKYDTSFSEVLQSPDLLIEEKTDSKRETKRFQKTCFNCDGDHFISHCPHQLDPKKIANARKRSRSTFVSNKRYHVCGSQESDYKPGIISDELRKALNLQQLQIPSYIYRMRIIDYPPGWMQDAVVESSGIALYGCDDIAETDKKDEEDRRAAKVQYDPDKLIDYPGFNVPLPPDYIDESSLLGMPPMQSHQMRNIVEQVIPKPDVLPLPSRKRKLVLPAPQHSKIARCDENMDIDEDFAPEYGSPVLSEFVPPLPNDALPPLPADEFPESPPCSSPSLDSKLPTDPESSASQSGINTPVSAKLSELSVVLEPLKLKGDISPTSGTASPSLRELEEIKKRLVIELGITVGSASPAILDDFVSNDDDDDEESFKINPSCSLEDNFGNLDSNNDLSNFSDSSFSSDAKASCSGETLLRRTESVGSKLVSLGTPSISRHSSFTKLPNYENFSKDVTSHLNFENLPNSVGTYEKMKKVIKKVKDKINLFMH